MGKKAFATIFVIVLIVLGGGIFFVVGKDNPQGTAPTATPTTTNNEQVPAQVNTIVYTDDGFTPDTLTVKQGTTVTVENKSSQSLEFSSGPHPTHTAEPELNLAEQQPGQSATFVPTKIGTWSYHNHFNEEKTGTLVVTE